MKMSLTVGTSAILNQYGVKCLEERPQIKTVPLSENASYGTKLTTKEKYRCHSTHLNHDQTCTKRISFKNLPAIRLFPLPIAISPSRILPILSGENAIFLAWNIADGHFAHPVAYYFQYSSLQYLIPFLRELIQGRLPSSPFLHGRHYKLFSVDGAGEIDVTTLHLTDQCIFATRMLPQMMLLRHVIS